jgi:hypothetical protein
MYERLHLNGNIYFVKCRRFLKIGFATDVRTRIADLQTGNPFELRLIAELKNHTRIVETWFHEILWKSRTRGEWFRMTKLVWAAVDLAKTDVRITDNVQLAALLGIPEGVRKWARLQEMREKYGRRGSGTSEGTARGRHEEGADAPRDSDAGDFERNELGVLERSLRSRVIETEVCQERAGKARGEGETAS